MRPCPLLLLLLIALAALGVGGCSHRVRIDSVPPGARLSVEGSFVGYTPVELDLASSERDVFLELDGHRPATARLQRRWDSRSLLNLPVFPVMAFPSVVTRLSGGYVIDLERGDTPVDLGVVRGADPPEADAPAATATGNAPTTGGKNTPRRRATAPDAATPAPAATPATDAPP